MMVTLLVISAITAGLMPVNAATNQLSATRLNVDKTERVSDVKLIPSNSLFFASPVETVDLSTIDERISEAEQATPVEEDTAAPLWYLNAYGYTTITSPTAVSYTHLTLPTTPYV